MEREYSIGKMGEYVDFGLGVGELEAILEICSEIDLIFI